MVDGAQTIAVARGRGHDHDPGGPAAPRPGDAAASDLIATRRCGGGVTRRAIRRRRSVANRRSWRTAQRGVVAGWKKRAPRSSSKPSLTGLARWSSSFPPATSQAASRKDQYLTDVVRLALVVQAGGWLEQLPQKRCPVCGAAAEHQRDDLGMDAIAAACSADADEIGLLMRDLDLAGGTASARGREAVRVASVMPSGGPPRRYQRAPGHRQYHPPDVRGRIVRNPRTRTPRNGPGSGAEFRHICRRPIPVSPIRVRFGMVPPCGPLGQAAWAREPQPDHWPA